MQKYYPTTLPELRNALTQENAICIIENPINLTSQTICIASGVVIRFEGGLLTGGTLFGNESGIPTSLEVVGNGYVFDNVTLKGSWQGRCSDLFFRYEEDANYHCQHNSFYPIMLNLFAFQEVELHRSVYYFDWPVLDTYRVINAEGRPFILDGHNAIFYISKNKGGSSSYDWGWMRVYPYLFNLGDNRSELTIKNLTIIDNNDITQSQYYGEENCNQPEVISEGQVVPGTEQINYYIFYGIATRTVFENIRYDGGGCFHGATNETRNLESLQYTNCDLFTKGFVLEVANTPQIGYQVGLDQIVINLCTLHSHVNKYAGPLSFVGSAGVKRMIIRNSKICGCRGNSEFFGVKTLVVDNCILVNQGPSSEYTNQMPVLVKYTNCHFFITEDYSGRAYSAAGKNLYFSNNIFQISHRLVFSEADRLFLLNNTIIVPSSETNYIFVVNDSVKIGYYHNNAVACPRMYENHVSLRLDNPNVLALYSPFQVAFCENSDRMIYSYNFGPWNNFQDMSSQSLITTDNDGYARTNNESLVVPSPSPVNDTVSVSLIGKMFSEDGVHPIGAFTIGNTLPNNETVQTTVTIEQSYGYIYLVRVGNTALAYVLSRKYNGFNEDVRLDITATAVNGFLELFVFVNLQLFAKARYDESIGLSAGNLTITPNSSTGIKQFRFVPGGFIGDEPNDFINESVLG